MDFGSEKRYFAPDMMQIDRVLDALKNQKAYSELQMEYIWHMNRCRSNDGAAKL